MKRGAFSVCLIGLGILLSGCGEKVETTAENVHFAFPLDEVSYPKEVYRYTGVTGAEISFWELCEMFMQGVEPEMRKDAEGPTAIYEDESGKYRFLSRYNSTSDYFETGIEDETCSGFVYSGRSAGGRDLNLLTGYYFGKPDHSCHGSIPSEGNGPYAAGSLPGCEAETLNRAVCDMCAEWGIELALSEQYLLTERGLNENAGKYAQWQKDMGIIELETVPTFTKEDEALLLIFRQMIDGIPVCAYTDLGDPASNHDVGTYVSLLTRSYPEDACLTVMRPLSVSGEREKVDVLSPAEIGEVLKNIYGGTPEITYSVEKLELQLQERKNPEGEHILEPVWRCEIRRMDPDGIEDVTEQFFSAVSGVLLLTS